MAWVLLIPSAVIVYLVAHWVVLVFGNFLGWFFNVREIPRICEGLISPMASAYLAFTVPLMMFAEKAVMPARVLSYILISLLAIFTGLSVYGLSRPSTLASCLGAISIMAASHSRASRFREVGVYGSDLEGIHRPIAPRAPLNARWSQLEKSSEGGVQMTSLIMTIRHVHECLNVICEVESGLLKSSIFSLFKKKNYPENGFTLSVACEHLSRARANLEAYMEQGDGVDILVSDAKAYTEALLASTVKLAEINNRLHEKAQGKAYFMADYTRDVNEFKHLQDRYCAIGDRLNESYRRFSAELASL